MSDETCATKSTRCHLRTVNTVLKEVDFQIRKLDECVGKAAAEMLEADAPSSKSLVDRALDANKKACILAELRVLLQQQKQKEGRVFEGVCEDGCLGGNAEVPQAVLDLIQMGHSSCQYHLTHAFGGALSESTSHPKNP